MRSLARYVLVLGVMVIGACGDDDDPETDAAPDAPATDGARDSAPDASVDGAGDSAADAPPDSLAAGTCASPIPLDEGSPVMGSTVGAENGAQGTCGGLAAGELVLVFTVDERMDVIVSTNSEITSFDTAIYVRSSCDDSASQLACASSQPFGDAVEVRALDPGTYYLIVDGVAGAEGTFEARLRRRGIVPEGGTCDPSGVLDRCEGGSSCLDGTCTSDAAVCEEATVAIESGVPLSGTTVGGTDRHSASCSADGSAPEVVHRLEVTGPSDLLSTVSADFDVILSVWSVCGEITSAIGCSDSPDGAADETVDVLDVPPGVYYLSVDGYAGESGAYTLDARVRPILGEGASCDPAEVVDRCGDPLVCVSDGGGGTTCQDPFALACAAATSLAIGATVSDTLAGGASTVEPSCRPGMARPEALYAIDLAAPAFLHVSETGGFLNAGALTVLGPDSCEPAAELACSTSVPLELVTPPLAAGRYVVAVDGTGDYTIVVAEGTLLPDGSPCDPVSTTERCGAGSFCISGTCAPVLSVVDTTPNANFCDAQGPFGTDFLVDASLSGASDLDNFEVTLAAPGGIFAETSDGLGGCDVDTLIEVFALGDAACGDLDAGDPGPIAEDDDGGPDFCSQVDLAGLEPGTYFVRVRRGAFSSGPYTLLVDLR